MEGKTIEQSPETSIEQETSIEVKIDLTNWDCTDAALNILIKKFLAGQGYVVHELNIFPAGFVVASLGKDSKNLILGANLPDSINAVLLKPETVKPESCTFTMTSPY